MISIERNGTWRNTNRPCFAQTWKAHYFEWTLLGICVGVRIPRIRKDKHSPVFEMYVKGAMMPFVDENGVLHMSWGYREIDEKEAGS